MQQYMEITTMEEWKKVLQESHSRPVFILKHSTRCPISASAFHEYQKYLDQSSDNNVLYVLVKIVEAREVSNQIEKDLDLRHESPQGILVEKGKVKWNDSHWSLTEENIRQALS